MKAFVDTFGAGATAGPLDALAKQLASHVGDSEFMVSHVLRFTLFSWTEAQAVSRACCANPLTVTLADYQAWISRFGTESDEVAYVSAKSLFTVKGNDVQLLPWYYGLSSPSAGTAQATLAGKAPGSFLVRISGSTAGAFAFSYTIASGEIRHTRVHRAPGGYLCDGRTTLSPTLPDLVKTLGGALITPVPSTLSQASLATLPAVAAASPLAAEDASSAYASYNEISTPSVALPAAATVSSPTPVASPASSSTPGAAKEAVVPTKAFDVMISYNWSSQPLVLRLKQELDKLGLATWLDLSHMSQTYLSDMVSAVHNARCVILCVSEKYLKSENCLTEVNLVCELRSIKPYIIAVLEKDLVPSRLNHPIAVLAAAKLYCNFAPPGKSEEEAFQAGLADVKRQLIEKKILAVPAEPPSPSPSSPATTPSAGAGAASGGSSLYVPTLEKAVSVSSPMESAGGSAMSPGPEADAIAVALSGVSVS